MVESTRTESGGRRDSLDAVFSALADGRRRQILGLLSYRAPTPVSRDELATTLAARWAETSRTDVTGAEREQAAIELYHAHLPKLEDAGLLEWDPDGEIIALADHPAYRDPGILEAIEDDVPTSPESLDALFGAIADDRRRTILDVLSHQSGPIPVETVARELEADGRGVSESDVPTDEVDRVSGLLVNADLPRLSQAGLIEFDADEGRVEYAGHPQLRVPWIHSSFSQSAGRAKLWMLSEGEP